MDVADTVVNTSPDSANDSLVALANRGGTEEVDGVGIQPSRNMQRDMSASTVSPCDFEQHATCFSVIHSGTLVRQRQVRCPVSILQDRHRQR